MGGNSLGKSGCARSFTSIIRLVSPVEAADLGKSSFLLTKSYLDCVAESGDAVILNVVDLQWNGLAFHYGSLLTSLHGKVASASSLHGSASPTLDGGIITLHQPGLGIEGTWEALRTPVRRTVFQNAEGFIDWHCLQPMAQVELHLRGGVKISGLGYAECLTVSLLPWQLPLTSLRWGRYLSRDDALVWIHWPGPEQKQAVIYNGEEHYADSITESGVLFADGSSRLGTRLRARSTAGTAWRARVSRDFPFGETASAEHAVGRRDQVAEPRSVPHSHRREFRLGHPRRPEVGKVRKLVREMACSPEHHCKVARLRRGGKTAARFNSPAAGASVRGRGCRSSESARQRDAEHQAQTSRVHRTIEAP